MIQDILVTKQNVRKHLLVVGLIIVWILFYGLGLKFRGYRTLTAIGDDHMDKGHKDNVTNYNIVFYNRVPKCGSSTTIHLFTDLARKNHFHLPREVMYPDHYHFTSIKQEEEFVREIESRKQPLLFTWHLHFINFTRYSSKTPVYINLVRDPIDRMASFYYYLRFGRLKRKFTDERRNMLFDTCVQTRDAECVHINNTFILTPFFCGHDPRCRTPSSWALSKAEENIKQWYAVVGYLKKLPEFYKVLEQLIPKYFHGLHLVYKDAVRRKANKVNYVKEHRNLLNETVTVLMTLPEIQYEYRLYEFIKTHFKETQNAIGVHDMS